MMGVRLKPYAWSSTFFRVFIILTLLVFPKVIFAAPLKKPEMTIQKIQVESLSVLEQALKSKNPFVRSAAVRAAGESQNPVVTPLLKRGS